jgi:hypothetical protein
MIAPKNREETTSYLYDIFQIVIELRHINLAFYF